MSTAYAPTDRDRVGRSPLLTALLVLGALIALLVIAARIWTDYLWFRSLSMTTIFTTRLAAGATLLLVFGLVMGVAVYLSLALAYRFRPRVRRANLDSELLIQMRDALDRRSQLLMIVPAVVLGLMGGLVAVGQTPTLLAWWRATPFGVQDAIFGMDASFYVFQLPWWRFVLGYLTVTLVISLIGAAIVHFLTGSLTVQALRGSGNTTGVTAQRHLSIMLGLVLLTFGVGQILERFAYLTTTNKLFTGVTYTDLHARIPAHLVIGVIAGICAVLCFVNAWRVRWSVPGVAVGLLLVSTLLLNAGYPYIMQQFEVNPDEPDKERPYIEHNLAATRYAFGIDDVEITDYEATTSVSAGQLRADAEALPAIRLIDPSVTPPTFEQLQQVRGYYSFPRVLDVDRYRVEGRDTDAVVAARELNLDEVEGGNTWNNMRTVYTHGYGLVAAYGNQRQVNGEPVFFSGGIPTVGVLPEHEPRIYFGERSSHWVVVGGPEDRAPVELDTPGGGEGGGETFYTYTGRGGVPVGSFFNRALFAIRFADINLMLSDRVNSESKVLLNREPSQRVREVAPFLTLDSDAYPTVVDGRIKWVIDAYTTTADFPNSTRLDWSGAISDTRTNNAITQGQQVNYVRNSVKATVDAYDGTVTLYEWDETDPILKTWEKVYPGVITPKEQMSDQLLEHLRYPADLFKAQRETLSRYHTTSAATWYQRSDVWSVPNDPVRSGQSGVKQSPYFLTVRWPGEEQPTYSNTTVFVPLGRENLTVFMAVNSDATTDDYGKLRVLKLSDTKQIAGPGQTFNSIRTDPKVADRLLPFSREGSTTTAIYGNLLTLPVGGGLLYVQPIYTRSETTGSYPALRFVVVRFGEEVGIGSTLQEALDAVFRGDAGADTRETVDPDKVETPDPSQQLSGEERAKEKLRQGMDRFREADEALREGDLATYQEKNAEGRRLTEEALKDLDGEN